QEVLVSVVGTMPGTVSTTTDDLPLLQAIQPQLLVTDGTIGVPAYVRLAPVAMPSDYVEAFAAPDGMFSPRVIGQPHDVLVVPEKPQLAPRLFKAWNELSTTFVVDG